MVALVSIAILSREEGEAEGGRGGGRERGRVIDNIPA